MNEFLQGGVVWMVTGSLLVVGLVGCVLPALPGHLFILLAAIGYRLMVGPDAGIAWWGFGILLLLMAISQIFEIVSGSLGTQWFGGTKWGALGALVGGIVGIFFLPFGLLIGPLIGAFGFERLFAKREIRESAVSGVGSMVGTLVGIIVKVVIGVAMVVWFFLDIWMIK
ncbi:MAG: DUF456 domain-containing protein [Akkermansiaceae bacterium]|nr:DUF456 domain-containing protein [Luteolibacter sp.]